MDQARGMEQLVKVSRERLPRKYSRPDLVYREGNYPERNVFLGEPGKVKNLPCQYRRKRTGDRPVQGGRFLGIRPCWKERLCRLGHGFGRCGIVGHFQGRLFYAALFNNRDVASRFIKMLSDSVAEKEERLLRLAYNSVRKRLADALLLYRERYKNSDEEPFSMDHSAGRTGRLGGYGHRNGDPGLV